MRLRPRRFWTPRYIRDRLFLAHDQRSCPDDPWWPRDAIRQIDGLLVPSDRMLEWGSGRSTAWLNKRVQRLLSVEHNAEWFHRVQDHLGEQGVDRESLQLLSTEPQGRPSDSPYVRAVDAFADGELTACLVDGEHRSSCASAAVPKLASGGLLILDDAHLYIDHPTRSPHARIGKSEEWDSFSLLVAEWRCVWTTDGVTDTAIWIKP